MNKRQLIILSLFSLFFQFCQPDQESIRYSNSKSDSLNKEVLLLKEEVKSLSQKSIADRTDNNCLLEIDTLTGSFTEAFLGDCFHLSFKDLNGKIWNFNNPDNIYGMDILDVSDELKLKKEIPSRTFKIWYADLKGIDCQSSESYHEQKNRKYIYMPTILKVEEVEKR